MYNNQLLIESLKNLSRLLPLKSFSIYNNEISLYVKIDYLEYAMIFLKLNTFSQYKILSSITGVDYIYNKFRFEICYDLLSLTYNNRIKLKVYTDELTGVNSCEKIYSTANWYECEIWDLFGIFFKNHSNLKRILTDYGFLGNPLKKDFPLSGFIEVKYNENKKKIISEPLEFSQEYRTFNYLNPWD
jgi:NADH dehydrogenase (ubiquinone) Fe-S protein 3